MQKYYTQAFAYMANGYSVIPVGKDKKPLISWKKYQKEKADESQIEQWWKKYPEAGVGIITGEISGITVVDIDVKNNRKTDRNIFPETQTVQTPSGGFHLYYQYSDTVQTGANQFEKYPFVDIRNDGGYVVAPPTLGYKKINNEEIKSFPKDLFPIIKKRKSVNELVEVGSGKRNDSMASMIGKLLLTTPEERWLEDAWPVIVAVNKTYNPPLPENELRRTFQSIAKSEKERRKNSIASPMQVSENEIISLRLRKNKSNVPYKDLTNAVFALQSSEKYRDKIRFECFSGKIEINGKIKNEEQILEVQKYLQNDIGLSSIARNTVEDAIQLSAFENKYDAAVEYITGLKWDGTPRVDKWLSEVYGVEEDEYTRAIGSNWLRALVKRIMRPGTKFDYVLVIEGEQGIKKTLSLAILGGDWHVETVVEAQSKDFLMQFQGKALVELSEGDTLTRSEVKTLKAIITRTHDKYRAPYARQDEEHPRRCVFAMTTNDDTYLKDDTGNRRWWPIKVPNGTKVNTDWLKENRDQLFAEAYQRVEEPVWKIPEDKAKEEQEKRRFTDDVEDKIMEWYATVPYDVREKGITIYDFYDWLYRDHEHKKPQIIDMREQLRIGSRFRTAVNLKKEIKKIDGKSVKRFFPTDKSPKYEPAEDDIDNF